MAQEQITKVRALGDGNCAFNSFALGLSHLVISGKLNNDTAGRQTIVLNLFKDAGVADPGTEWGTLKEKIRIIDKDELQRKLSTKLRTMSADSILLEDVKVDEFSERTSPYLIRAYTEFKQANPAVNFDDIFQVHQEIKAKFATTASVAELSQWWKAVGAREFLQSMKANAVFAGDLELVALANYFHLELKLARRTQPLFSLTDKAESVPEIIVRHEGGLHWDCDLKGDVSWLKPVSPVERLKPKSSSAPAASQKIKEESALSKKEDKKFESPKLIQDFDKNLKTFASDKASNFKAEKKDGDISFSTTSDSLDDYKILAKCVIETLLNNGYDLKRILADVKPSAATDQQKKALESAFKEEVQKKEDQLKGVSAPAPTTDAGTTAHRATPK